MSYTFQDVVISVAKGGAALTVAYGLANIIGDLAKGHLRVESVINFVIAAILFWLSWNYEIISIIYGWVLLAEIALTGFFVAQHHKK
jgi:hypothetical protein